MALLELWLEMGDVSGRAGESGGAGTDHPRGLGVPEAGHLAGLGYPRGKDSPGWGAGILSIQLGYLGTG